jgi:hypothetical protein
VVTAFTFGNSSRVDTSTLIMASSTWGGVEDDLASLIEITSTNKKIEPATGSTSFVDSSIAKRVRMAAQTIIAPCIAPVSGSKGMSSPQQKDYDVRKEVVARENALYIVAGLVNNFSRIESVVWPLRRALNEIEDANPLDDDRVDPQLDLFSLFSAVVRKQ